MSNQLPTEQDQLHAETESIELTSSDTSLNTDNSEQYLSDDNYAAEDINKSNNLDEDEVEDSFNDSESKDNSDSNVEIIDIEPANPVDENLVTSMPIDITILGEDFTVFCPIGEEEELSAATVYINDFIEGIRQEAPTLSHKNLLVLSCLNLYEQMKQAKAQASLDRDNLENANKMVDQMIEDMQLNDD